MGGQRVGGGRKTINSTENTRTGLAEAPPSNRLRSAAFSPFFKRRRGKKKRRKKKVLSRDSEE